MSIKKFIEYWKYPSILLFGVGVSNLGAWVYLIGLNLIVLEKTGSPLAVSALYILIPLATLFTNFWAGSLIDRLNKRNLMAFLDIIRSILILFIPLLLNYSLWLVYVVVFFINMGTSMFSPTSMTYITKLIPSERRKRFNSLHSLTTSGAFLIGPAVAGILFLIGTPTLAIYVNAIALFISGLITLLMPNLEMDNNSNTPENRFSFDLLKKDWRSVLEFSRSYVYIMLIYFLFSCMMVMATAVDSLEAAFAKDVLLLSDSDYGFLVSIAGAGIVVGALVNTLFVKKIATSVMIGLGSLFVSVGYLIYAFSTSFEVAAIGFFVLAFFLSFANTGFYTFYQTNIPVDVMGRVGSIYGLIQAILIITSTVVFGIIAHLISIQNIVIAGSIIMLFVTTALCFLNLQPSKRKFYNTATAHSNDITD
jgi:MFS family permease